MAKRVINFGDIIKKDDTPIVEIMPSGSNTLTATRRSDGEFVVITREQAKNRKFADYDGYQTNQTDLVRGGIREEYIETDMKLIANHFIAGFESPHTRKVVFDDENYDSFQFINFPLPEYFKNAEGKNIRYETSGENFIMTIPEYPEDGPWGVYVKNDSLNLNIIKEALAKVEGENHIFSTMVTNPYEETIDNSKIENKDWSWVCFHYQEKWSFNRQDLTQGDCLIKYVTNLHLALEGKFSTL